MFENGCYLRRQKRFKCPIRQAQKAAQRAAAGRLSVESGTGASRDLNRKFSDDVTSCRRSTPKDDPRQLNSGVTSLNGVAQSHRKLSDDVISSERRTPNIDHRRFNNSISDNSMRTGLSENHNGGHVTYGTSISGGSHRELNASALAQNCSDKACSLPHYRYQQHTV